MRRRGVTRATVASVMFVANGFIDYILKFLLQCSQREFLTGAGEAARGGFSQDDVRDIACQPAPANAPCR